MYLKDICLYFTCEQYSESNYFKSVSLRQNDNERNIKVINESYFWEYQTWSYKRASFEKGFCVTTLMRRYISSFFNLSRFKPFLAHKVLITMINEEVIPPLKYYAPNIFSWSKFYILFSILAITKVQISVISCHRHCIYGSY